MLNFAKSIHNSHTCVEIALCVVKWGFGQTLHRTLIFIYRSQFLIYWCCAIPKNNGNIWLVKIELFLRWECEKKFQMDVVWIECGRKRNRSRLTGLKEFQNFFKQRKKLRARPKKIAKCMKYFETLVEKGKDVEKILKLKKLKREENKRSGELSKRLGLVEEKTESKLRRIFSHTQACTTTHFNFQLYIQHSLGCILSKIQVHLHPHVFWFWCYWRIFVNKHHIIVLDSKIAVNQKK